MYETRAEGFAVRTGGFVAPALNCLVLLQPSSPDCHQQLLEDKLKQLEPDVSGQLGDTTWSRIHQSAVVIM